MLGGRQGRGQWWSSLLPVQGPDQLGAARDRQRHSCLFLLSFLNNFIYFFIFGCAGLSLLHGLFSSGCRQGRLSSCGVRASPWGGFPLSWSRALRSAGFARGGSQALEHRLDRCGAWAERPGGMGDRPRSGMGAVDPASVGGFFTTEPPAKPRGTACLWCSLSPGTTALCKTFNESGLISFASFCSLGLCVPLYKRDPSRPRLWVVVCVRRPLTCC